MSHPILTILLEYIVNLAVRISLLNVKIGREHGSASALGKMPMDNTALRKLYKYGKMCYYN